MSGALAEAFIAAAAESEDERWLGWLKANVETGWRPGEWQHDRWLFSGDPDNPATTVMRCVVVACGRLISAGRICRTCNRILKESDQDPMAFAATHRPTFTKGSPNDFDHRPSCPITHNRKRCPLKAIAGGPCAWHRHKYHARKKNEPALTLEQWVQRTVHTIPTISEVGGCAVPTCPREAYVRKLGLCDLHTYRYYRVQPKVPVAEWARSAPIWQSDHQFSLSHLSEQLRWEVLYALQQRDKRGGKIDPRATRQSIGRLITMPSLSTMGETQVQNFILQSASCNANAYTSEFARVLRVSRDRSEGRTPTDRLIWDLVEVGMQADPTAAGGTRRRVGLDFSPITQTWLRTLAMTWARKQDDHERVAEAVRACVAVSLILSQRPDRGTDMSKLGDADAEHIAEGFGQLRRANGNLMRPRYQRYLHQRFFDVIKFGRIQGSLDELPQPFRPHKKKLPQDSVDDDDIGKAIPQGIQRQLDANIDSIGRSRVTDTRGRSQAPYRHLHTRRTGMSDDDVHEMYRTVYIVMRDTGRRPVEVLSLKMDCLDADDNGSILIWNNFKSRRFNRRLPIGQSTAEVLRAWFDRRTQIAAPEPSRDYAFPAMSAHARKPHVPSTTLAHIMRTWVDGLDRLDTNDLDEDGNPIPFDRGLVYPYAFRHSYAQRHADNGTPVDVLRDLMDHRSMETTARYYTITATRKRDAVDTVSKLTIDRHGNTAAGPDATTYQTRSVAVPYGNCIEPTNVKAGGQNCPIRFQCAGCGFYRPDPSFIPAIDEHLNALRADRETAAAMDTATFVTDNLSAQIESYERVLATMKDQLAELDDDERERVEFASTVLRKARAGASLPLKVLRQDEEK